MKNRECSSMRENLGQSEPVGPKLRHGAAGCDDSFGCGEGLLSLFVAIVDALVNRVGTLRDGVVWATSSRGACEATGAPDGRRDF